MRTFARRVVVVALTAGLALVLALPASADQIITYRGETSQAEPVILKVLKRDGERFLTRYSILFTMTCEDGSTGRYAGLGSIGGLDRLGEGGEFEFAYRERPSGPSYRFAGTVRFGSAEGTLKFSYASLTDDDQAQLCTTGDVDWLADRRRSDPARITRTSPAEGVTFLESGRRAELVEAVPSAE
jgi:hypothetical protein